jgi:hypothetical protein
MPQQPWPMEVIVGLTLVVSFAAVVWVAIGAVVMVHEVRRRRARKHLQDVIIRIEANAGPFLQAMAETHAYLSVTMQQMGDAMKPLAELFRDLRDDLQRDERLMYWEDDGGRPREEF